MTAPVGQPGFYPANSNTVTKETYPRVAFDPSKGTFGPMRVSVTRHIEVMNRTSDQVSQVKVPVDLSSPTTLGRVKKEAELEFKAETIKNSTQGVNVNYPLNLLKSVRSAQQNI